MKGILLFACLAFFSATLWAEGSAGEERAEIMHAFTSQEKELSDIVAIETRQKQLIMFIMGVPLLIMIIITVALGVAMVAFGKRVFVPHMIFAGLSLTLALAHAVAGLVWFYPF